MITSETILTHIVEHAVLSVLTVFCNLRSPRLRCDYTYAYQPDYAHVCQPSPLHVVTRTVRVRYAQNDTCDRGDLSKDSQFNWMSVV